MPIVGRSLSRAVFDEALATEAIRSGAHFLDGTQARLGHATETSRSLIGRKDGQDAVIAARVVLGADGLGGKQLAADGRPSHRGESGLAAGGRCRLRRVSGVLSRPAAFSWPADRGATWAWYAWKTDGSISRPHLMRRWSNKRVAWERPPPSFSAREASRRFAGWSRYPGMGLPSSAGVFLQLAAERVFLLGDAAGYVEPFTGEGMAWAVTSGIAVAPLALRATRVSARLAHDRATLRSLVAAMVADPSSDSNAPAVDLPDGSQRPAAPSHGPYHGSRSGALSIARSADDSLRQSPISNDIQ